MIPAAQAFEKTVHLRSSFQAVRSKPHLSVLEDWLPLAAVPLAVVFLRGFFPAWGFMCVLAFSLFFSLKWVTWRKAMRTSPHSAWRSAAYLLAWPGMDAKSFLDQTRCPQLPAFRNWLWACSKTGLGAILLWFAARHISSADPLLRGWAGMVGFVLLLHFGSFHLLALIWRRVGFDADPIMAAPAAVSIPFGVLGQTMESRLPSASTRFSVRSHTQAPLTRNGRFLCLPRVRVDSRPGYFAACASGLRLAHFILRSPRPRSCGGTLALRQKSRLGKRVSRAVVLLFCSCRSARFAVSPRVCPERHSSVHGSDSRTMTSQLVREFFNLDLWFAGIGHFLILLASFQVPFQLRWKQDLQPLMPFNRKLLWVQSSFTVLTILAFGSLTLALHRELLQGDRAALGLAAFIGLYWTARILVDAFYFSHHDWPKGKIFVVGHILLTALFSTLAASYLGLFFWQVWFSGRS
jgi:hypothetical protein